MEKTRLQFATNFFLLSLLILFFTYLSTNVVTILARKNIYLVQAQPPIQAQAEPKPDKITLSLLGPNAVTVNDELELLLILDTTGQAVQAVDVILQYDPNLVEYTGLEPSNMLFESIPGNQQGNRLSFSLLATNQSSFRGKGQLATVKFFAKKTGKADITIISLPGSTTDSNVILQNKQTDALEEVENIVINIL